MLTITMTYLRYYHVMQIERKSSQLKYSETVYLTSSFVMARQRMFYLCLSMRVSNVTHTVIGIYSQATWAITRAYMHRLTHQMQFTVGEWRS